MFKFGILEIKIVHLRQSFKNMVENNKYTAGEIKKIESYTNTAIEVFDFVVKLPSPLGEFVFKRIIEDAYYIASVQQFEKIKEQLIESICISFQPTESVYPICNYLGIPNHYKEVDSLVTDIDELNKKLKDICKFNQLPPIEDLLLAYPCFSFQIPSDDYKDNTKELIRKRIIEFEDDEGKSTENDFTGINNSFIKLGYQTLFMKWLCDYSFPNYNEMIFRWFCKGELIDSIFDTIFKSGATSVSQSLWDLLVRKCEQYYFLSKITQQRFDYYRVISPNLAYYEFKYKGEKKLENTDIIVSLPQIPKSKVDSTPIDDDCLYKLHARLVALGKINCTFECFKSAFSGYSKTTLPIKWLQSQKDLATFLYVLRAEGKTNKAYSSQAAKVFIQKNGKACSASTLDQYEQDKIRDYKNLFKEIGIIR